MSAAAVWLHAQQLANKKGSDDKVRASKSVSSVQMKRLSRKVDSVHRGVQGQMLSKQDDAANPESGVFFYLLQVEALNVVPTIKSYTARQLSGFEH